MNTSRKWTTTRFLPVLLLPALALAPFNAALGEKAFSFGVVPQFDVRRIQHIWTPILNFVSEKSGVKLTLDASADIPRFETDFSAGKFDFAYMNPYHLIVAHRDQGYLPMVRDVENALFGIIVVRKESPLRSVDELDGKTVAFPAPNALGAALMPRAEFSRKFHIDIIPKYVRSHTSVYLNVVLEQADAGGGVQKTLEQQKPAVRDALRILYRTSEVAPHPVACHPRVDGAVAARVRDAFLALGASEEGRALLAEVPIKRIGRADMADYAPLRALDLDAFYIRE